MKRIILYLFLFVSTTATSQTFNQYLKAGNDAFNKGEYFEAISYFKKASKFQKKSDDVFYKIGQSYLELKDYSNSLQAFSKVKTKSQFPFLFYKMGNSYMLIGSYNQAIKFYNNFKNTYNEKDFFFNDATQKIASCYWAIDHQKEELYPENKDIKIESIHRNINTQFSEFAVSYFKDSLLQFTSFYQEEGNRKREYISDIFFFKKQKKNYLKQEVVLPKDKNLQLANGFYVVSKKRFYYNQCESTKGNKKRCDLYVIENKNNAWSEPISLNINDKKFTTTQATAYVNVEGKDVIFFVSDREGGFGKNDIWTATESSLGIFEKLENLPKEINTINDEASPFYDSKSNTLYFSSKWHYGFGGFDIFSSLVENNSYKKAENIGIPYNSSANDLYFKKYENDKGFLSSNRKGAMILRGAACCYDIFDFEKEITLLTEIIDSASKIDSLVELHTNNNSNIEDSTEIDLLLSNNENRSSTTIDSVDLLLQKIRKMLPVTVYFHNDEPNPKTTNITTSLTYTDAYKSFYALKSDYYKMNNFNEIDAFFYDKFEQGYIDLKAFKNLLSLLIGDHKIKLYIKGYCSPLAQNNYNINLSKRRISSLENEFNSNTVLNKAISNNQIRIAEIPFGEEKSKKDVSDDYNNVKESIYNPKAAEERKVSIIGILIE